MANEEFEKFIFSHYDTDKEFVKDLQKLDKKWNIKKFSRIKNGQEPKISEAMDMAKATQTPLIEIARFFTPQMSQKNGHR